MDKDKLLDENGQILAGRLASGPAADAEIEQRMRPILFAAVDCAAR